MFQMFHMDAAMVVFECCTCCNCYTRMLQEFVQNVSSVSDACFKVLSGCCICCNDYVANVCFKSFICFRRILQLFHLSVVKADLDVGLLSEEERACVGAMAASMWGEGAGRTTLVWKRRGSHPSGMEEVGEAPV